MIKYIVQKKTSGCPEKAAVPRKGGKRTMNDGVVWFMPFEETLIVWLQQLGAGTLLQTVLIMLNNFFSF